MTRTGSPTRTASRAAAGAGGACPVASSAPGEGRRGSPRGDGAGRDVRELGCVEGAPARLPCRRGARGRRCRPPGPWGGSRSGRPAVSATRRGIGVASGVRRGAGHRHRRRYEQGAVSPAWLSVVGAGERRHRRCGPGIAATGGLLQVLPPRLQVGEQLAGVVVRRGTSSGGLRRGAERSRARHRPGRASRGCGSPARQFCESRFRSGRASSGSRFSMSNTKQ